MTESNFDAPSSLMQKTLELAEGHKPEELFRDTGIPFHWLKKFIRGEFQNPSVNRVQFLYEHLTKTKLKIK